MANPKIPGEENITIAGGLGGAVSPQWGPGAKHLTTKLNVISRLILIVECLKVPLWYKQKMTYLNRKFN